MLKELLEYVTDKVSFLNALIAEAQDALKELCTPEIVIDVIPIARWKPANAVLIVVEHETGNWLLQTDDDLNYLLSRGKNFFSSATEVFIVPAKYDQYNIRNNETDMGGLAPALNVPIATIAKDLGYIATGDKDYPYVKAEWWEEKKEPEPPINPPNPDSKITYLDLSVQDEPTPNTLNLTEFYG